MERDPMTVFIMVDNSGTLSCDQRIFNGAEAGLFLGSVVQAWRFHSQTHFAHG